MGFAYGALKGFWRSPPYMKMVHWFGEHIVAIRICRVHNAIRYRCVCECRVSVLAAYMMQIWTPFHILLGIDAPQTNMEPHLGQPVVAYEGPKIWGFHASSVPPR